MLYHPVKIGSLTLEGNLFLAPIAGYSDRAFRSVCVDGGADFTYTEMVSSEALVHGSGKTELLMARAPGEKSYAVQIFGGNPEIMAAATKIVLLKTDADCIDINCGCPVPKITKTGSGSALTRDPKNLYAVVKAVVTAVKEIKESCPPGNERELTKTHTVPITVKIRSGWDESHITWKEAAMSAIEAGASAVTLHARTRAQGYEGKADWNILSQLVRLIDGRVPVFGSGDVFTPEDAKNMLEQTGCDAVMFARGAMGHPFIFRQTKDLLQNNRYDEISVEERIRASFTELNLLVVDRGEENACREMRKRFCAYSKGIPGGANLRSKIVHAEKISDYQGLFSEYL